MGRTQPVQAILLVHLLRCARALVILWMSLREGTIPKLRDLRPRSIFLYYFEWLICIPFYVWSLAIKAAVWGDFFLLRHDHFLNCLLVKFLFENWYPLIMSADVFREPVPAIPCDTQILQNSQGSTILDFDLESTCVFLLLEVISFYVDIYYETQLLARGPWDVSA